MECNPSSMVWTVRCADYGAELDAAVSRIVDESGLLSSERVSGRRVVVKPNLLTDRTPDQAVTTHPELLRAVIRRLKAAGADVAVGDSPASAVNIDSVLELSGTARICREENVPFLRFEGEGARVFESDGFKFPVARPAVEADLLVNLPKVKSHSLTKLTAAVKNLYGAIPGYSKTTLHRLHPGPREFGRLLKAIWRILPPAVSIADAVVGMEGQGPANGRPVRLGFLAASADPFALDIALCRILHINPRSVPYLEDVGTGGETRGDEVSVPSFATPSGAHLLSFLPARLVRAAAAILWVRPQFDPARCVKCGRCVKACPAEALTLAAGAPVPDLARRRCIGCACCHEVCPKGAVAMRPSPILRCARVFRGM